MDFSIGAADQGARAGTLKLTHGVVQTPVFMPVATSGVAKGLEADELKRCGTQLLLANALHLMIRPGLEDLKAVGGLHRWMGWDQPILMDSGGYQVYSLAHRRSVSEQGVRFRSFVDGSPWFMDPETSIAVQQAAGVDIMMQLDECVAYPASFKACQQAMERSLRWARRCLDARTAPAAALFGIVQGQTHQTLRYESAKNLALMPMDGYAHGGLGLGEPARARLEMVWHANQQLPEHKPRYLMGLGTPADLLQAVGVGVDMFDCVLPTRNGRHGWVYHSHGVLKIDKKRYALDDGPLERSCGCAVCERYSRSYLHHLFRVKDPLGARLVCIHNLHYYHQLLGEARRAITQGCFAAFCKETLAEMGQPVGTELCF